MKYLTFILLTALALTSEITIEETLELLLKRIKGEQTQKDSEIRTFPPKFHATKGLFKSYVHLNTINDKNSYYLHLMREHFRLPDENMFVTTFVITNVLEASRFNAALLPEESIKSALEAILKFKDGNDSTCPRFTFWLQDKDEESNIFYQRPANLNHGADIFAKFPDWPADFLKAIGLGNLGELYKFIKSTFGMFGSFSRIPVDLDDTSVNLGLFSLINRPEIKIDSAIKESFSSNFTNIQGLFDQIKKYAYNPFSESQDHWDSSNLIDTRTYYALREVFYKAKKEGRELLLPTTWMTEMPEQLEKLGFVTIPFNSNNVDLNVASNWLFGIFQLVDNPSFEALFDKEILKMIDSTLYLFEEVVERNLDKTQLDKVFLYYPSLYDFYWLCSRTFDVLKRTENQLNFVVDARNRLERILKGKIHQNIYNDRLDVSSKEFKHCEFLGNFRGMNRGEDCVFVSGMAINTLINTWTEESEGKLRFTADTPVEARVLLEREVHFVQTQIKANKNLNGAFFSGSIKGNSSIPFFFPKNYFKKVDGSDYPPDSVFIPNIITGVKGFISKEEYDEKLKETIFGQKAPEFFEGLNDSQAVFPYWSSHAMTFSVNYLALAKYNAIVKDN